MRPPHRPARATARSVLRPLLLTVVAIIGAMLLLPLCALLTPDPELRAPVHRYVVDNFAEVPLRNLELTIRASGHEGPAQMLEQRAVLQPGERWVVERGLAPQASIGLAVDEGDARYEFHHVAWMSPELGELHLLPIWPGPRVNRSDADVVRRR